MKNLMILILKYLFNYFTNTDIIETYYIYDEYINNIFIIYNLKVNFLTCILIDTEINQKKFFFIILNINGIININIFFMLLLIKIFIIYYLKINNYPFKYI